MNLSVDLLLGVCLGYVALLFILAFFVDKQARQGRAKWIRSPVVYTLSITVYCTSWTFYGAVGSAARNGIEFITIYLGPTLVFIGWWWLLRKLVRIGRTYHITSIADLISSRYGKSPSVAVLVTLMALIATTPYIALQLQSVTRSYQAIVGEVDVNLSAFIVAAGMALFTILFGTRHIDANERHHGVVAAIAVEAVVKLAALLAVGLFVVFGVAGGLGAAFENVDTKTIYGAGEIFDSRWVTLTFLSATAVICLPRQFQVTVVENIDEKHLATASWLFPLYLFGMCLFVMPIAIAGLNVLPESNPDLYVLTLPLSLGRDDLALLAFLGGFSSATSMIIIASIAVSTMLSNHIIVPIALRLLSSENQVSGDVKRLLLNSRRFSIAAVLGLGYLYFRGSGGSDALAAIGLIAFLGVAQFLPSLLGAIFWREATRVGAIAGLLTGFVFWAYTLFLPSFGGSVILNSDILQNGLFGIAALRPQSLFGLAGLDPLVHAVIWSLGANTIVFILVSSYSHANPLEQLQGVLFVDVFRNRANESTRFEPGQVRAEDLFVLAQRILGTAPARALFDKMARDQGQGYGLPQPTDAMILQLEQVLSGSIGAASAHAMVARVAGYGSISMNELINIADETQRLIETSKELSEKSSALSRTTSQLRDANKRLRHLDQQKDDFLSQVSHELRTPMTSIRSFSELLLEDRELPDTDRKRFVSIINEESLRLTRLLDEILDMSRLESGAIELEMEPGEAVAIVDSALNALDGIIRKKNISIRRITECDENTRVIINEDRCLQVLINLLSNAIKYNNSNLPEITIRCHGQASVLYFDISDNGGGVSREDADTVFDKFSRGKRGSLDQGAGLGLAISRTIARRMGGDLTLEFNQDESSYFRLRVRKARAPQQDSDNRL